MDNQNGSVEVSSLSVKRAGACNSVILKTSFAPIRVYLPEDGSYNVVARTSFGKINSELPLTVTGIVSNDSLSGRIGGGDCRFKVGRGRPRWHGTSQRGAIRWCRRDGDRHGEGH